MTMTDRNFKYCPICDRPYRVQYGRAEMYPELSREGLPVEPCPDHPEATLTRDQQQRQQNRKQQLRRNYTMPEDITIEKDVPRPNPNHGRQGSKYPFEDMDIGDSFGLPFENEEEKEVVRSRVNSAMTKAQKNLGIKLSLRTLENEVRVWRIAPDGE